jgi:hypothetical protein
VIDVNGGSFPARCRTDSMEVVGRESKPTATDVKDPSMHVLKNSVAAIGATPVGEIWRALEKRKV